MLKNIFWKKTIVFSLISLIVLSVFACGKQFSEIIYGTIEGLLRNIVSPPIIVREPDFGKHQILCGNLQKNRGTSLFWGDLTIISPFWVGDLHTSLLKKFSCCKFSTATFIGHPPENGLKITKFTIMKKSIILMILISR